MAVIFVGERGTYMRVSEESGHVVSVSSGAGGAAILRQVAVTEQWIATMVQLGLFSADEVIAARRGALKLYRDEEEWSEALSWPRERDRRDGR